ncbi:hypothetical protein BDN71DRAFT_608605 [Pleurotus eryngii]|uniref:Uncharacterized protein n=1 Tax=Pleurotus eryngii TaxID=5323 RepID=A0A9P6DI64_PLEER|nr:hypothetical protein BDN71DRAFT_608605 [Pleurotus eryngii]
MILPFSSHSRRPVSEHISSCVECTSSAEDFSPFTVSLESSGYFYSTRKLHGANIVTSRSTSQQTSYPGHITQFLANLLSYISTWRMWPASPDGYRTRWHRARIARSDKGATYKQPEPRCIANASGSRTWVSTCCATVQMCSIFPPPPPADTSEKPHN